MTRDFSAIKTLEDAQDALVGAKVIEVSQGGFIFETIVGERFSLKMVVDPISVQIGNTKMSVVSDKITLKFDNEVP